MGRKKITEEELLKRVNYASYHTLKEFSRQFGIKENTASVFYSKHGIPVKQKNQKQKLNKTFSIKEVSDYSETHTLKETSLYFGVTYQTLYRFVKENNIKFMQETRGAKADKERKKMIKLLSESYSETDIARAFGVSRQYIWTVLHKEH